METYQLADPATILLMNRKKLLDLNVNCGTPSAVSMI